MLAHLSKPELLKFYGAANAVVGRMGLLCREEEILEESDDETTITCPLAWEPSMEF